ncbi:IS3 family transposase [Pandoraea horticolens]|uniref:IS3 family transposase n=1 Tax=Pandoraea horticolens TaxID=2508298 RepID=A0A5E4XBV2_9BURK|nr:IS3 family transposase [Pandoraea horticolens]
MDFVFDRTAEGRAIKNLTIVDDGTHEAVAIVPERAIRNGNGNEFCNRAMLSCAHGWGGGEVVPENGETP